MDEKKGSGYMDFSVTVIVHNFFNTAKRLIWIVLVLALLVGGLQFYRVNRSYVPKYASSVVFSVKANFSSTTDIEGSSAYLDSNAALALSQTFPYVIGSENTRMLLQMALGTETIPASISATSTAESALFTMTATGKDPEDVYNVLMAAISIYPQAASSILGDTQIIIISQPLGPSDTPINRNNAASSARTYGFIVFVAGVIAIFLFSLTRKTVHSAEDLRKLVNLPCLAYIPTVRLKKRSSKASLSITITNPHMESAFSESIRSLRVKLQKALTRENAQILLVTSTIPDEGKSTVAVNVALSLAAEKKRVILIDGDLRNQSLKAAVGLEQPSDGLVEVLTGTSQNFRLLSVPNSTLLLLSGDRTTDRPQPLLDSARMRQLLTMLREKLDYIIIDTPPAGILSDAATVAKYADAALYVVRQDTASTSQILDSIQNFAASDCKILGCVLNQTQTGTTRYGYSSKYAGKYASYGDDAAGYRQHLSEDADVKK